MEAQYYLNLFQALVRKIQNLSNFEQEKAVQIALAIMQELSKDRRVEEMKKEREKAREEPATGRQLAYLKVLGANVKSGITKQEASEIIEKFLKKR